LEGGATILVILIIMRWAHPLRAIELLLRLVVVRDVKRVAWGWGLCLVLVLLFVVVECIVSKGGKCGLLLKVEERLVWRRGTGMVLLVVVVLKVHVV
jgi:hypothetical protein